MTHTHTHIYVLYICKKYNDLRTKEKCGLSQSCLVSILDRIRDIRKDYTFPSFSSATRDTFHFHFVVVFSFAPSVLEDRL